MRFFKSFHSPHNEAFGLINEPPYDQNVMGWFYIKTTINSDLSNRFKFAPHRLSFRRSRSHWRGNLKENWQLQEIATSAAPPRNDNWMGGTQSDKPEFYNLISNRTGCIILQYTAFYRQYIFLCPQETAVPPFP